jgi:hypothetical protein
VKDGMNNITLLGLPAPQQYWWNVRCETNLDVGGSLIFDVADVNWTFIIY